MLAVLELLILCRYRFTSLLGAFLSRFRLCYSHAMSKVSVRYIVADVDGAIPFYTEQLGFRVESHPAPGFASLARGDLLLLLNQPGAGGAGHAMPDGQVPTPGGWNRVQLEVGDITATVEKLKGAGCRFRNEIVTGRGGKQVLVEDPSGNLIELFEPA